MKYKVIIYLKNGKKIKRKFNIELDDFLKLLENTFENFREEKAGCLRLETFNIKTSEIAAVDFKRCLL
jgi:hypothetical protein